MCDCSLLLSKRFFSAFSSTYLSALLQSLQASDTHAPNKTRQTILAPFYGGAWTPYGRETQAGHSIGASVTITALTTLPTEQNQNAKAVAAHHRLNIPSPILETTFYQSPHAISLISPPNTSTHFPG